MSDVYGGQGQGLQQRRQLLTYDQDPPEQWAAMILLTVQAVERLHTAFDGKFIRSKSLP